MAELLGLSLPGIGELQLDVSIAFLGLAQFAVASANARFSRLLRKTLDGSGKLTRVEEVLTPVELLRVVGRPGASLVLVDGDLPDLETWLDAVRSRPPDSRVVVVGTSPDPGTIAAVISQGADGYILASVEDDDFAAALEIAAGGHLYTTSLPLLVTER